MLTTSFEDFAQRVADAGLRALDRGSGHWQIVGGPLLVNYYPRKATIYVAGTTGKTHGNWDAAIAATRLPPERPTRRDERHGSNRKIRRKMLAHSKVCRWCGAPLTLDTSTVDHVDPLSRGGLDNANNRVLACKPCNERRGNAMPELAGQVRK
jgi:hypothetical protein